MYVCGGVHVYHGPCVEVRRGRKSVLCFYHTGSEDQTLVIRLEGTKLKALSPLTALICFVFSSTFDWLLSFKKKSQRDGSAV